MAEDLYSLFDKKLLFVNIINGEWGWEINRMYSVTPS